MNRRDVILVRPTQFCTAFIYVCGLDAYTQLIHHLPGAANHDVIISHQTPRADALG